jgi:hypothetical protein
MKVTLYILATLNYGLFVSMIISLKSLVFIRHFLSAVTKDN